MRRSPAPFAPEASTGARRTARIRPGKRALRAVVVLAAGVVSLAALACSGDGGSGEARGSAPVSTGDAATANAGDGPAAAADSIIVIDAADRRVALAGPARRIVSLVPSATATLHAIGATHALVGRTDFDRQPWAADLPSVGGGLEPSLEAIVALDPDLVVRFGGPQDPRTPRRLDELGVPFLTVRPDRIEDILETARLLGDVTGMVSGADSLTAVIESGLDEIRAAVAERRRLRVAYVLGGSPPWVSGPGTYIDEVLTLLGGDNVFADLGTLYSAVSPEDLRTRDIDVVLLSASSQFDQSLAPDARVVTIGDALEIPGPDVVEAARHVAELLHGRPLR